MSSQSVYLLPWAGPVVGLCSCFSKEVLHFLHTFLFKSRPLTGMPPGLASFLLSDLPSPVLDSARQMLLHKEKSFLFFPKRAENEVDVRMCHKRLAHLGKLRSAQQTQMLSYYAF